MSLEPPSGFVDVQRRGPFLLWEHARRLASVQSGTESYDHLRYRLSSARSARLCAGCWGAAGVEGIFDYRGRHAA